jgi:hypothetical protein
VRPQTTRAGRCAKDAHRHLILSLEDNNYMESIRGSRRRKIHLTLLIGILAFFYLIMNVDWHSNYSEVIILVYKVFMFILLVSTAIYCWSFATRVVNSRQYPPPGADMPFTIKIVKGKYALAQGYSTYALVMLILIYVLYKYGPDIYNTLS